jgi:hypothetical protein
MCVFFDNLMLKNSQEAQRTAYLIKIDRVSVKKCKKRICVLRFRNA